MTELDKPLVSIIIPCYMQQELLPRAINSCLSQRFKNFEIIIVDDGSVPPISDEILDFDHRIALVRTKNQGLAAARNKGLEKAKGTYIKFLDSDDELLENCLALQVPAVQSQPGFISIIGYESVSDEIVRLIYPKFDDYFSSIFIQNLAPIHSFLYAKEDLEAIDGFCSDQKTKGGNEDYDLHLRLAIAGLNATTIHAVGARYYQYSTSMSKKRDEMEYSLALVMESAVETILKPASNVETRKLLSILMGLITKIEQLTIQHGLYAIAFRVLELLNHRKDVSQYYYLIEEWFFRIKNIAIPSNRWLELVERLKYFLDGLNASRPAATRLELVSMTYPLSYRRIELDSALVLIKDINSRINADDRVLMWGSGYWGNYWTSLLKELNFNIVAVIDKNPAEGAQQINKIPVYNAKEIYRIDFDKVVICSYAFFEEIRNELELMGLEHKVLDLRSYMIS